jgi:uncharacterized DUF497 family protein
MLNKIQFDYDPFKSDSNRDKHGIDFIDAQMLWENEYIEQPSDYVGENRTEYIGKIKGKYWFAVATKRNGKLRIISVRRARKYEREEYDKEFGWN